MNRHCDETAGGAGSLAVPGTLNRVRVLRRHTLKRPRPDDWLVRLARRRCLIAAATLVQLRMDQSLDAWPLGEVMVLLPVPAGSPVNRHRDKLFAAQGRREFRRFAKIESTIIKHQLTRNSARVCADIRSSARAHSASLPSTDSPVICVTSWAVKRSSSTSRGAEAAAAGRDALGGVNALVAVDVDPKRRRRCGRRGRRVGWLFAWRMT